MVVVILNILIILSRKIILQILKYLEIIMNYFIPIRYMYQNFWQYAVFVIVLLVSIHYLAMHCMTRDFGYVMVFLSYLFVAYLVANSIRFTNMNIQDPRERMIRMSFDVLIAIYLIVTAFHKYGERLMSLPGRIIDTSVKTVRKAI